MEYLICQNFNNFYKNVVRTRRYKSLLKYYYSPFLFSKLLNVLITTNPVSNYKHNNIYLNNLKLLYQFNMVWYLYNTSWLGNKGFLTNNISYSYSFQHLYIQLKLLSLSTTNFLFLPINGYSHYLKSIKISYFFIKNKNLSVLFFVALLIIFKFVSPYFNIKNITYSFITLSKSIYFFILNNNYYFKLHNY